MGTALFRDNEHTPDDRAYMLDAHGIDLAFSEKNIAQLLVTHTPLPEEIALHIVELARPRRKQDQYNIQ